MLLATPPSMSMRSSQRTGGRTAGIAELARTALSTGPRERRSSSPLMTSTATTCSGIGISSKLVVLDVAGDQSPQAGIGDEVVAGAEEAEQPGERVQREDLPAPQLRARSSARASAVCDGLRP